MVGGGESEVCKLASHALVSDENILRLQVPVVDSNGMAVLHGIQDLEESPFRKCIIACVLALLSDVGEQITFWAVLHNDIGAVRGIHDSDKRNHIWVCARLVVKLNLPLLELPLARLKTNLVESLHGIWNVGLNIYGCVDHSICSYTQDSGELQPSGKNLT